MPANYFYSRYRGTLTSTRISILGFTICLFQDRETIERIWKSPSLSSSIALYRYSIQFLFGGKESLLSILRADDSGPYAKPYPNSIVAPDRRLHHIIHDGLSRGLTGPALIPTTDRYIESFIYRLKSLTVTDSWFEIEDLNTFIKQLSGEAVIEAIFGPTLHALNPKFVEDLWKLDADLPRFSKGFPAFLNKKAQQNRQGLVEQIIRWYNHARDNFDESMIEKDGDGDPIWGSAMIRKRQETILGVVNQDDENLATLDLGLAWA